MEAPSPKRTAWPLVAVVLVSLLAHAPCLSWGFFADDCGHQLVLSGTIDHESMRPWNLYDFGEAPGPGDPTYEVGGLPWWTPAEWKVRFFRPVASISLWLDHALYGSWAPGYHLSGLLWFGAILVAAHALYRALGLSPRAALLATLFVGLEDGAVFSVGWPANRNSVMEVLFLTLAALAVARKAPLVLALLLALGAALSKESGVVAFALVGLLLLRRSSGAARPVLGVSLAAGLALAFVGWLVWQGYGANSRFYPEPWDETGLYLKRMVVLVPNGLVALAAPYAPDLIFVFPELTLPLTLFCLGLLAAALPLAWPRVRAHPAAAFLLGWVALTLLPQSGAPISDRLLLAPMVGAAGLFAIFLDAVRTEDAPARGVRVFAWALLLSLTVLSGGALLVRGAAFGPMARGMREAILSAEVGPPEVGRRDAILLNTPSEMATLSPLTVWMAHSDDEDVRFWALQLGRRAVTWTRTAPNAFELRSEGEPFCNGPIEAVFLSAPPAFSPGERFRTALFDVEVVEVDDDGLRTIRVELPDDADNPRFRFLAWRDGALRAVPPPAVGETFKLAEANALFPMIP